MTRARTTLTGVIAIGLLAGSAVGVAAQDEGAAAFTLDFLEAPPIEFNFDVSAVIAEGNKICVKLIIVIAVR